MPRYENVSVRLSNSIMEKLCNLNFAKARLCFVELGVFTMWCSEWVFAVGSLRFFWEAPSALNSVFTCRQCRFQGAEPWWMHDMWHLLRSSERDGYWSAVDGVCRDDFIDCRSLIACLAHPLQTIMVVSVFRFDVYRFRHLRFEPSRYAFDFRYVQCRVLSMFRLDFCGGNYCLLRNEFDASYGC